MFLFSLLSDLKPVGKICLNMSKKKKKKSAQCDFIFYGFIVTIITCYSEIDISLIYSTIVYSSIPRLFCYYKGEQILLT